MPDTSRNVGDIIGLASINVQIGLAFSVAGPPAAILELRLGQPGIGALGSIDLARDAEPHGGLSVVPGVGMSAVKPRYLTRGALGGEQELDGGPQPLCRIDPGAQEWCIHAWLSTGATCWTTGLVKYSTMLLPMMGFNSASMARVIQGRFIKSQTNSR